MAADYALRRITAEIATEMEPESILFIVKLFRD
jgi:hypothetical protein